MTIHFWDSEKMPGLAHGHYKLKDGESTKETARGLTIIKNDGTEYFLPWSSIKLIIRSK